VGHNSRPSTTDIGFTSKWRVRGYTSITSTLDQIVRPPVTGMSSVTNLSGAFTQVAVPAYIPSTTWLTAPAPAGATSALFSFSASGTDAGNLPLKSGANLQTFSIFVRKNVAGGTNPTLKVELYDNGVLKATLVTSLAISSTSGILVVAQWNASALGSLLSQTVQVKVTATAGTTSTIEYGAVEWLADHTGYTFDSGDLSVVYPLYAARSLRTFTLAYVLPATATVGRAVFGGVGSVLVDQCFTKDSQSSAGRLMVANGFQPFVNFDYGWTVGWADPSIVVATLGGQEWADVRQKWRLGEFACNSMTQAEAFDAVFAQLQAIYGITGDFLWFPDPANNAEYFNTVIYGRFSELSPVANPRFQRFAQSYKVKESL
jgi:hypothetical protein